MLTFKFKYCSFMGKFFFTSRSSTAITVNEPCVQKMWKNTVRCGGNEVNSKLPSHRPIVLMKGGGGAVVLHINHPHSL